MKLRPVASHDRPFLHLVAEAASTFGARVEVEAEVAQLAFLVASDGARRPIHGAALGLNGDAAARLAADKDYTARLLALEGLPTPCGFLLLAGSDPAPAIAWARQAGFPVWLKPNGGHAGSNVRLVRTGNALPAALSAARRNDQHLLLQRHVEGRDYRVMVLDGAVVGAWERIPAPGQSTANLSTGAAAVDLVLSDNAAQLAVRACHALGLQFAGVDILAPALAAGAQDAVVLEVNSAPGLDAYASASPANWDRAREIIAKALIHLL